MLKGASEDQIMGRTHISYWLSEFKSSAVSAEDAELFGHPTKSTTDGDVDYRNLYTNTGILIAVKFLIFWISFMAIRRILKDSPKMCHVTAKFTARIWPLFFVCIKNGCHFLHSLLTRLINV